MNFNFFIKWICFWFVIVCLLPVHHCNKFVYSIGLVNVGVKPQCEDRLK